MRDTLSFAEARRQHAAGNSKGRWEIPAQVPFNFTEMGENILIPENAKFEQVKPWGRNATKADGTEADPQDP